MRKIVLLLAALALAGCGEEEPALIDVKGSHGKPDAAAIWGAIVAFQQACPDLSGKYWGDVESATAEVSIHNPDDAWPTGREEYGWKSQIYLEIKFVEHPKHIPSGYLGMWRDTVYIFGGGHSPGVLARESLGQRLCPMTVSPDGGEALKSVPAMAVIDGLG